LVSAFNKRSPPDSTISAFQDTRPFSNDAWVLQQLPGRIAGLLDVLDATIPNLTNKADVDANVLRHRIEAVLRIPRPVIVADRSQPADKQAASVPERVEGGVLIEAALSDGRWLLFRSDLGPRLSIQLRPGSRK
jgi:hypothetical protein